MLIANKIESIFTGGYPGLVTIRTVSGHEITVEADYGEVADAVASALEEDKPILMEKENGDKRKSEGTTDDAESTS